MANRGYDAHMADGPARVASISCRYVRCGYGLLCSMGIAVSNAQMMGLRLSNSPMTDTIRHKELAFRWEPRKLAPVEAALRYLQEATAADLSRYTSMPLEQVYEVLVALESAGKARVYATDQGRKAKVRTWGWVDGVDIDIVHRNK